MSATAINTINQPDLHMPQLEPVDLSRAAANTQTDLETFLQRVREGRTELTIQAVETSGAVVETVYNLLQVRVTCAKPCSVLCPE